VAGSIRPRLASAVSKLKEHGDLDEAAAVAALLGPRGYLLLKRTETGDTDVLSITVPSMFKQAIVDTADDFDVVLDALAEEAYRRVLDEGWVPAAVGRVTKKTGDRSVLQVQVDSRMRAQVQNMLDGLGKRAGHRVTESNIVLTHVCEELGIERPAGPASDEIYTRVPETLRDHWRSEAARRNVDLRDLAEDGIRTLLASARSAEQHPYVTAGARRSRRNESTGAQAPRGVNVKVQVDRELLMAMRSFLDELSGRLGHLVGPGMVLRAILTDRLGVPEPTE